MAGSTNFLTSSNRYVDALVVPFGVIVRDVFGYRCPQVSLTERYEAVETLST